jgi:hypothetical protein
MRPDDCSLPREASFDIQRLARQALIQADGMGRLPTPVDDIVAASNVVVVVGDELDPGFLSKLRGRLGPPLKRALSKVLGVLDAVGMTAFIDPKVHRSKQPFLKLHETAHAALPWQRELYVGMEDCEKTIGPDIAEQFEREANVFASEVLFQLDSFTTEAAQCDFGLRVPLKLAHRYGTSVYAAVRRYVSTHRLACAVLVLDPPTSLDCLGFSAPVRRVVSSASFQDLFGHVQWPDRVTPEHPLGRSMPIGGRKMSPPACYTLTDLDGAQREIVVEGFTQGYQVFLLLHAVATLPGKTVIAPWQ